MWPGMRPATGWMAYLTVGAAPFEDLGELAHGVLGLGDGHPVAGDDDERLRRLQNGDRLVDRGLVVVDSGSACRCGAGRRRLHFAEGAEQDVGERAVHRLAHLQRQQEARRCRRARRR